MKILVINCGSSSLKYQMIDMTSETLLAKGLAERIGLDKSFVKHTKIGTDAVTVEKKLDNHRVALETVMSLLLDDQCGVIKSMKEIGAVGHRVAHGADKFSKSTIVDSDVLQKISDCTPIAPLHTPPNMTGIEACIELMPGTPNVAVFDTAFHQTMPDYAYTYAIPYEYYEKYSVRRYGFHGTSHKYVAVRAAALLGKKIEDLKIVCCHLGNGSSITAIDGGKSIENSMGFTPLEGLLMGTRCGTIDPAIVMYLMDNEDLSSKQVNDILNKKSGIQGVSGVSSDFRDVLEEAEKGNRRAALGLEMFAYQVKKYIGSYAAAMGGIDAIIFTAGIGENDADLRLNATKGLEFLGVAVDPVKNKVRGQEVDVSTESAKVRTLVIPTNEELAIARDTYELVR